jgi:hypothetical protein
MFSTSVPCPTPWEITGILDLFVDDEERDKFLQWSEKSHVYCSRRLKDIVVTILMLLNRYWIPYELVRIILVKALNNE